MKHDLLKLEVERIIGHRLTSANEFEQLSHLLLSHTHERLSPTTLKRLWGYLKNEEVETRRHTLDVLSRFVGFGCYEDFCAHLERLEEVQSGISIEERITTERMRLGQRLVITWRPNRRMVVRHLGSGQYSFSVRLSIHSMMMQRPTPSTSSKAKAESTMGCCIWLSMSYSFWRKA